LLSGLITEEAGYTVRRVGGPIDEGDSLAGKAAIEFMVFDEQQPTGDAEALGDELIGVKLVVEDVGEEDDVEVGVGVRDAAAVIGLDGDEFAGAFDAFEAADLDIGGTGGRLHQGQAEGSKAAADVEDAVAGFQMREDLPDQFALPGLIDGAMQLPHQV
jgi:hypothetical protein